MIDLSQIDLATEEDDQIRKMCRDRIEYHQDLRNYERFIAKQEDIIADLRSQVQILTAENEKLKSNL